MDVSTGDVNDVILYGIYYPEIIKATIIIVNYLVRVN